MADTKISGLTAVSAAVAAMLVPVVEDPGGTPITKKATLTQISALFQSIWTSLQFGGTSSSFPMLKRAATKLQVRLADDSAYAGIEALTYDVGAASDTTIARDAAGSITVEGKSVWRVLASSAVAVTRNSVNGAGDQTEETAATVTVPAGAMGANGRLRITSVWSYTSSAGQKLQRIRFGGASGTQYLSGSTTTTNALRLQHEIANRNATNSQVGGFAGGNSWGTASSGVVTSSVDTTAAVDIVFTTAWAAAASAESLTLESYLVEVMHAA